MKKIIGLSLLVLASGCSLAPKFETPDVETPSQYKEAVQLPEAERGHWKEAQPSEHVARGEWWRVFNDEALNTLQTQALAANAQLQAAAARVRQARAIVGIVNADRLPQLGAGFGPSRTKPTGTALGLPQGVDTSPYTIWRADLNASWEVDLFGRIGDGVRAAESEAGSSEATYQSLMLALQADVASVYFQLRAMDSELALLRDTVDWRHQNVDLTQKRFNAGAISELDLARAKTELATTQSEMHALERQRARLEHALAVLLGRAPANFTLTQQPFTESERENVPVIPAGLPSTLLERRPDVVAAQQSLMASNARIGVARAAFFPVLNLTANGGFASEELGDLFNWSSRTWALGPLAGTILTMPIFSGGRNTANLDRSWAAYDEAVANYRDRVLNAFADVEDSLSDLRTLDAQARANASALVSSRRASGLTDSRYKAGAASYFEVIDVQRSQLDIERLNVQIDGARRLATVSLIRALGGGWSSPQPIAARSDGNN
ncbi:MAG TPA: efflux transporter outer membrane subunit [Burkholderiales bacterium]|nr:efflux transporter outer membrane subunit [Burkholderiales bacterium]